LSGLSKATGNCSPGDPLEGRWSRVWRFVE